MNCKDERITKNEGKPRVLFITDAIEGGGAEKIALEQARSLDPTKYEKTLLITRKCDNAVLRDSAQYALRTVCLNRKNLWDIGAYYKLYRELKKADIIHAHKDGSIIHAVIWGKLARCPRIVGQLHSRVTELPQVLKKLRKWACGIMDSIIMISQRDCEEHMNAWQLDPTKVTLLYNGIDCNSYGEIGRAEARARLGLDNRAIIIGAVGRISRVKGYEYLLGAAALINHEFGEEITFLITGGGSEEEYRLELEGRAKKLVIEKNLIFLGYRRDVALILPALDIFVLPSVVECHPLALLEAMASGLPVVATRVGGVPEVVVEGESGLLVPPRDPQALAAAILYLLKNPEIRQNPGAGRAGKNKTEILRGVNAQRHGEDLRKIVILLKLIWVLNYECHDFRRISFHDQGGSSRGRQGHYSLGRRRKTTSSN